ncbi:RNA polymerase sporulation sigma factor SigH [Sporofaciens sp. SGI.106]|uniref:RNA polymerase sporulation sigma factor SigH n=1 Tax=Sporofaciens sp. SGI.106 TaxID=3420568 RepID=UPI002A9F05CF|nr:RNA polymerase sporulation sigma factor SigH [Lachnoclostridium sp.]
MANYETMTDEQLIRNLQNGEKEIMNYIMEKYKGLVRREAKAVYLLGGENDDLIQEGMIGLFKAVQDYDVNQNVSFYSFAKLCITRQMYSAITASKRKKHLPLNSYVSLYDKAEGEKSERVLDTIEAGGETNPEEILLSKENIRNLEEELDAQLSELEKRVLYLHLLGTDYRTIAGLLDKSPKTVDNALQRIKNKAEKIVEEMGH